MLVINEGVSIMGSIKSREHCIVLVLFVLILAILFCRYARVEVPLNIVPSSGIGQACIESLINLPHILTMEEKEAFHRTTQHRDLDLITKIHNASGELTFLYNNKSCLSRHIKLGIIGSYKVLKCYFLFFKINLVSKAKASWEKFTFPLPNLVQIHELMF